jgi:hypothetical protein
MVERGKIPILNDYRESIWKKQEANHMQLVKV